MMSSPNKEHEERIIAGGRNREQTSLKVGDVINPRELETIRGDRIRIPDPEHLVHLQFRRFAGCPVCNLHLKSIERRHDEILEGGIKEVVVFYSTREGMLEFQGSLPFAAISDPERKLYAEFSANRRASPLVVFNPRSWIAIVNTARGYRTVQGAGRRKDEERMGLPSDFLIDRHGGILAVNYGKTVDDHWSVDRLLSLAKSSLSTPQR